MRSIGKWFGVGALTLVLGGAPGPAAAAGWHGGGAHMAAPARAAPVGGGWRGGGAVYGRGYAPGYAPGGYRYAPSYHYAPGYRYAPSYHYAPGHWGYSGPRVWIGTTWAFPPHPGWSWIAPHWAWNGYSWVWQAGYWAPPPY